MNFNIICSKSFVQSPPILHPQAIKSLLQNISNICEDKLLFNENKLITITGNSENDNDNIVNSYVSISHSVSNPYNFELFIISSAFASIYCSRASLLLKNK